MKILILTDEIPYPPISGGLLRVYNLLIRVAKRHQVTLIAPQTAEDQNKDLSYLKGFCDEVKTVVVPKRSLLVRLPTLARYALSGTPLELGYEYSQELARKIRDCVSVERFDILQIEQSHMVHYREAFPRPIDSKCILMFHDIEFAQVARLAELEKKVRRKLRLHLYSRMMRRWEPQMAGQFDRCTVVSEPDRHLLLTANPKLKKVDIIPNGVDTACYQPLPPAAIHPTLLFVGNMNYLPCIDAMRYFCQEIFPRVQESVKEVKLWIVGKEPAPEVETLKSDAVYVTGKVEDVIPYYRQCTVCVVPLQGGGGTRLKILEAMALGRPVVSTTIGCEGLEVIDKKHLLIADTPRQFADATIRLLVDEPLRQQITTQARRIVTARYDWDIIAEKLMQIYDEMVQ